MAPDLPAVPVDDSLPGSVRTSPLVHGPSSAEWSRSHEALRGTPALWESLAFDGIQADGTGGLIELRRCPTCGSTLARPITKANAEMLMTRFEHICAQSLASLKVA